MQKTAARRHSGRSDPDGGAPAAWTAWSAHDLTHQLGGLTRRLADLDARGLEGHLLGVPRCPRNPR